ncbi:MAG: hydrogenase expression/formation protein [Thioalkalivibrio sp.]|nr:MAG: hydrogenase expression/formation protein [Thioalkalivibrio sp.]
MSLKDIAVRLDSGPGPGSPETTGLAVALLREVADHLLTVSRGGDRQVVELTNLPLSDGDVQLLVEKLGRGEVEARISAAGPTEVFETAFPGVWWVKYLGEDDRVITQQLEIGTVPMILEAHQEDIQASARQFPSMFDELDPNQH